MLKLASSLYRAVAVLGSEASCSYSQALPSRMMQTRAGLIAPRIASTTSSCLLPSALVAHQAQQPGFVARTPSQGPLPYCMHHFRSVFGAAAKKVNKQIHTHDKYKAIHPQPTYE